MSDKLRVAIMSVISTYFFISLLIRMQLLSSGGGISGLTLAIALARDPSSNISVDVYESTPSFTEYGAGIGVFLRPWKILHRLSLSDDIKSIARVADSWNEPRKYILYVICYIRLLEA